MRVLVVEGHAHLRLLYTLHFHRLGYQTVPVAAFDLAHVALMQNARDTLVFVNVLFPPAKTVECIRTLREQFPHVPVIASTPYAADVAHIRRSLSDTVQSCMCAPVSPNELQTTLAAAGFYPPDA